jgi:hypothetical protein
MNKVIFGLFVLAFAFIFLSCNSIKTTSSEDQNSNKNWDTNDSEKSTDLLVNKFIDSKHVAEVSNKSKPKIVVGKFDDVTNESINIELIEKNVERSLLNSGRVTFISDKAKREESRNSRKNTDDFKSNNEFKKYLKELNTDFFVSGKLELNLDTLSEVSKKEYKLSLQVLNTKNMQIILDQNTTVIK